MPQAQSGICSEANLHGLFLFFNVLDGHDEQIADKLKQIIALQEDFSDRFSEAMLSSIVAIGAQYWPHIYPGNTPKGLTGFPHIDNSDHAIQSQPYDLFIQIRSDRADVIHLFGINVINLLSSDVELVEQVKCFRFLDGRDFNGFIYGSDTPHGRSKKHIALVGDSDPEFTQGSFIHVQRFRHNLAQWQSLPAEEQELIMGRSRLDNQLLEPLSSNSHANRVELKDENGLPLLLNQGMPYGDMNEQGMFQVTCSGDSNAFETILKSRFGDENNYDNWLDYTQADMGASFFAPSVNFIVEN